MLRQISRIPFLIGTCMLFASCSGSDKPVRLAPTDPPRGIELVEPALPLPATKGGLTAEYFSSDGGSVVQRTERIDFDSSRKGAMEGLPSKHLSIRWSGQLSLPGAGVYRLFLESSGGVRLWVDGRVAVERHAALHRIEESYELKAERPGPISISLEYNGGRSPILVRLSWEGEKLPRQIIPQDAYIPRSDAKLQLPVASRVSPLFLEGTQDAEETTATVDNVSIPVESLSKRHRFFNIPLSASKGVRVRIASGKEVVEGDISWMPTPLEGESKLTLRSGDSLLLGRGTSRTIKVEGLEGREFGPETGNAIPFTFVRGNYRVSGVDGEGQTVGVLSVTVPEVRLDHPIIAQVGVQRTVSVPVQPADASVYLSASDWVTFGKTRFEKGLLSTSIAVLRKDGSSIVARIGSSQGPILATQSIQAFKLYVPAAREVLVNPETQVGASYIRMKPWIPGLVLKLSLDDKVEFSEGGRETKVQTSDESRFLRTVDRKSGEPVGYFPFKLKVPPREREFCFDQRIYEDGPSRGYGGDEIPTCTPPWSPGNVCYVLGYQSIIFTRAIDDSEDESGPDRQPKYEEVITPPPAPSCETPRLRLVDNPENWEERKWPLMSKALVSSGGGESQHATEYRLTVSNPEPFRSRLDNPIPALFGGASQASDCKVCEVGCSPVGPEMHSGTIPGRYTTFVEVCEDDTGESGDGGSSGIETVERGGEGMTPVGTFFVSKLDAHGVGSGTTDKFPDFAEVLPKLAGYVQRPVIQMDWGGDRSYNDCSLYGTVCSPTQNEWQFTAVAKDPKTEENIPAGYRIEWSGIPGYQVVATKNGQPLTVKVTLPAGRYFPTLKVFGPNPATGAGSGLVGKAEIHSIVVEERPTCNVGEKNPDVPSQVLKGTPFHVTNHIGGSGPPVDMRVRIVGSVHPHPDFDVRGRVSLDGYPQNEYWVKDGDIDDLAQVVTVPATTPQVYYLQGYQVASIQKDDLKLVLEGQGQLEDCAAATFFMDCTPCGFPPPTRYPVRVEWQPTDSEPFNSSYPVAWHWDEPDLKYEGDAPDVIEVQADHVADDPNAFGQATGYYIEKGFRGRYNLLADIPWEYGTIHTGYMVRVGDAESLTLVWNYLPIGNEGGGPNFCDVPTLRDLRKQNSAPDKSGRLTALLHGLTSHVQLDFTMLRGQDVLAKAGDRFCIVPHAEFVSSQMGSQFWKKRTVVVKPGDKVFHIVIPNKPTPAERTQISQFAPEDMFDFSDLSFAQSIYKDWKWTSPLGPGEESNLEIYLFDRYRNVIPKGVKIVWGLNGGGRLGSYDPSQNPNPQEQHAGELEGETGARGVARVHYTQERWPTCPWQMEKHHEPAVIFLSIDGFTQVATMSVVRTAEPLPELFPPLFLDITFADTGKADPANPQVELLDIAKGDRALVTARLQRGGKPVEGIPIAFSSTNGKLLSSSGGMVRTNAKGEASVVLTPEGAHLDRGDYGTILVTAGVEEQRAFISSDAPPPTGTGTVVRRSLPRWVSSAPVRASVEHRVLVSDAFGDRFVDQEVLIDKGEGKSPRVAALGGNEGNDTVRYPIYDSTQVRVKGVPNHSYHVGVARIAVPIPGGTPPVRALYAFDTVANGATPNTYGPGAARLGTGQSLSQDKKEGLASLELDGTGILTVPSGPAVDAVGGLEISFWVKPEQLQPSILLSRQGQYEVAVLPGGKVLLSTWEASTLRPRVQSNVPLAVGRWSFIQIVLSGSGAMLAVGPDAQHQDATWGAIGALSTSTSDVAVGRLFSGLMDALSFSKDGIEPSEAVMIGTNPDRTITTDANGVAQFQFQLKSQVAVDYRPVTYVITLYGSEKTTVEVQAVPKNIWTALQNVGRSFIIGDEGLGENPAWYEEGAAWASNMLPFLSSLRTLSFEIYKAATGCDSVSWMNVTFATVGLVADIATFGTAGPAIQASGALLRSTFKVLLKETVKNIVADRVFHCAIEGFVRIATVEVMGTDGKPVTQPAPWVVATKDYLGKMKDLIVGQYKELVAEAFRSADELFVGLQAFAQIGADEFAQAFADTKEVTDFFHVVYGEPKPLFEYGYAPGRGPPSGFISLEIPAEYFLPTGPLVKTRPLRSAVLREVFQTLSHPRANAIKTDKQALKGLRRVVAMVVNGRRAEESASTLALRVQQAIDKFAAQDAKALLRDFEELYQGTKGTPQLLEKVQDLARDFAARGSNKKALLSRTKGATYAIQEANEGIRTGALKKVSEAIEPKSPSDAKLFRDLLQDSAAGKMFIELKAVEQLTSSAVGPQMGRHFERVGLVAKVTDYLPVQIRSINPVSATVQGTIRDHAVKAIMDLNKYPASYRGQVVSWVQSNLTFLTKPLNYTPH